jgi:hypothetical protein
VRLLLALLLFTTLPLLAERRPDPTDDEAYKKLQDILKKQSGPYNVRQITRVGKNTVEFEAFISLEADSKLYKKILGDFKNYPQWAIKNINNKPSGGTYYIKIKELKVSPADPNLLIGIIFIDLPIMRHNFIGEFKLSSEETPKSYTVIGKMISGPQSILESADGMMKIFPAENKPSYRWIYVRSNVVLRNWLLYEAMPEKLLKRESGDRIQIVLDNYLDEEDRLKSSQSPIGKMEGKAVPVLQDLQK